MALFVRVGGGIYTKATGGGADHVDVLEADPLSWVLVMYIAIKLGGRRRASSHQDRSGRDQSMSLHI
jgi:hypothetical protein